MKAVVKVRIPEFRVVLFRSKTEASMDAGVTRANFHRIIERDGEYVSRDGWVYVYPEIL